ncbi:DeoR/GlpR family DNA-binding transcription regulator [Paraburkholderia phenoliruptrix]|uniref:DeoR/GlpR family DNA-binding transcription regulator n=1 Tax=Paraburkholderia phenoliruptrix TaxID=252970 RepID=UPI0028699EC8|nr:DeoR/GlpR family DNA-binding transcription regulator [Paraburkholderia phenoliruptrix]WMY11800.1 DeoR/GlpR family DNA-binding transcription regulator [Paraburkholderia phenoliruptrix]
MDQRTRTEKILERVEAAKLVKLSELSTEFGVSMPTIRKDIDELQKMGRVERVHGNVRLRRSQPEFNRRTYEAADVLPTSEQKALIGKKAADLIESGDSMILDCGATTTELAKNLVDRQNLRVVTNALNIAILLGQEPSNRVMLTGGIFKAETIAVSGEKASTFFEGMFVDKLFLAAGGVSMESGISYPDFIDIHVKRAMIDAAKTVYLLADSAKFGRRDFAAFGAMESVDYLITDTGLPTKYAQWLEGMGIQIIYA